MTKPVTSVAAMMLFEEGAFDLTDPIARYVAPSSQSHGLCEGLPPQPAHRAGDRTDPIVASAHPYLGPDVRLPPRASRGRDVPRWAGSNGARRQDLIWPVRRAMGAVATGVPAGGGERSSLQTCSQAGRSASGQPLDEFFRQRIFAPLGMNHSSFGTDGEDLPCCTCRSRGREGGPAQRVRRGRPGRRTACRAAAAWRPRRPTTHRFTQFLLGRGEFGRVRLLARAPSR